MTLIAKTFQGLEEVLAEELNQLGAQDVEIGRRMVSFKGDKRMMYKANFCCRTALRILKPIYSFKASDTDQLYDEVKKFDWTKYLKADQTFAIDSVVNSEDFRHSKFVTYRVKDAIADFFTERFNKRPSIRLVNADLLLNVHILNDTVTISLDSSGESLHKRGYRVAQTEAPINEVLAAGLILKTGWKGDSNFVDPMCGSGTFLIEAALIGANINPGVFRNGFAFEKWSDFDGEMFDEIYNDDSMEREFEYKIYGSDISPKAISIATENIKSAGVGRYIDLQILPFQKYEDAPENGILVTNPPYGERIEAEDMDAFYESIGERLKNVFKGYHAWIIGYKQEYFDKIGLKPSVKIPILNGALECEFREYVIFDGTYAEFRKEGRTIKHERPMKKEFSRERPKGWKNKEDKFSDHGDRKFRKDDRKFDRDRKFRRDDEDFKERRFDRDRKFRKDDEEFRERRFDRDRKFRKEDEDSRFERDRRGVRREKPKNALEERYHKPYNERFNDKKKAEKKSDSPFEDERVAKMVRFRQPTLFDDMPKKEVVMRHRKKNDKSNSDNED